MEKRCGRLAGQKVIRKAIKTCCVFVVLFILVSGTSIFWSGVARAQATDAVLSSGDPVPTETTSAESAPLPEPSTALEHGAETPGVEPAPTADPTVTDPTYTVEPSPVVEPVSDLAPEPVPEPAPDPLPTPEPSPTPEPDPAPVVTDPEPAVTYPVPVSETPDPVPVVTDPVIADLVVTQPAPSPEPIPGTEPAPVIEPVPVAEEPVPVIAEPEPATEPVPGYAAVPAAVPASGTLAPPSPSAPSFEPKTGGLMLQQALPDAFRRMELFTQPITGTLAEPTVVPMPGLAKIKPPRTGTQMSQQEGSEGLAVELLAATAGFLGADPQRAAGLIGQFDDLAAGVMRTAGEVLGWLAGDGDASDPVSGPPIPAFPLAPAPVPAPAPVCSSSGNSSYCNGEGDHVLLLAVLAAILISSPLSDALCRRSRDGLLKPNSSLMPAAERPG